MSAFERFHLPWNQSEHYWLCLLPSADKGSPQLDQVLAQHAMRKKSENPLCYTMRVPRAWGEAWQTISADIKALSDIQFDAAIVAGSEEPDIETVAFHRLGLSDIDHIAENLWLGDALANSQIRCYLQPIMDKRDKIFGYEAFARHELENGEVIGGGKIIRAAHALNIEHMLDRYLQVEAVKTFTSTELSGFLFVNFVPGFIHRPEIYLEKFTETAKLFAMPAKHLVLDFTQSESPKDMAHLKSIFDYCHAQGYSTALDDIESVEGAKRFITTIKPDFMKLDISLVKNAEESSAFTIISELVNIAHSGGCLVIAEGVETEEIYRILHKAHVDLFQGYFFSPPVAAIAAAKRAHA